MITLTSKERPELWFLMTTSETNKKSVPRARLLKNQYIPTDTEGVYELSDETLNVQCDHDKRLAFPQGTIFAAVNIKKASPTAPSGKSREPYYSAHPNADIFPVEGADTSATDPIYIQAYNDWKKTGKTPRITPEVKPEKTTVATVKSKSLLDELIRKHPCPTPAIDGFYCDPINWNRLIFNLEKGHHTVLIGDAGSGKTELAYLVAKRFGLELSMFDMGSKQDPVASLIGSHRHNANKGGSYFDRAKFTYAIEKKGLVLLDEISRPSPLTNNILLPVLDSRKVLQMDLAMGEESEIISVNPEARFIATANIGVQYTGTNTLDRALAERFKIINIDYPSIDIESELLVLRTKVKKKAAETIAKVASTIRTLNRTGELSTSVSLRHTLDAAELHEGGFDLSSALEIAFLPSFRDGEEERVLEVLSSR